MKVWIKNRPVTVDQNLIEIYRSAYGENPKEEYYIAWMRRKTKDEKFAEHMNQYTDAQLSEMANEYLGMEAEILE